MRDVAGLSDTGLPRGLNVIAINSLGQMKRYTGRITRFGGFYCKADYLLLVQCKT